MKILQSAWQDNLSWSEAESFRDFDSDSTLGLVFGDIQQNPQALLQLHELLNHSHIIGCSTSGEIAQEKVLEEGLIVTIIKFEQSRLAVQTKGIESREDSYSAGQSLAKDLLQEDLACVFLLSDGLGINGSDLTRGVVDVLGDAIPVTGGLAGDNGSFEITYTLANAQVETQQIVALGLYGDALEINCGSRGGWLAFGPSRVVTRSNGNVLYELDHQSALEIYKNYLGDLADDLPASGLRYPLELSQEDKHTKVVRTMLAIDEEQGSITFAGDVPCGSSVQLMRANVESLISGAELAAQVCNVTAVNTPSLAILISCVGRKLVLKQLVEEEVEAVSEVLGNKTVLCGFYSYGEIAPYDLNSPSELHNQTMTITALSEKVSDA
jgi:hypothetical protein